MPEIRPEIDRRRQGKLPRTPAGPPQPPSAVTAFALLLGGAAASMFLVGRFEQGNLGVFMLCAGAAMIGCPPLIRIKPMIAVAAAAFLLCSGLALLPARLFRVAGWRQAFAAAPDLPLPETVSAAPEQTVFWLAVLTVTVLTGLFMLTQPVRSREMSVLALAAAGVCGLYAALSILGKIPGWIYPFSSGDTFGFFPNRNHTATLLVIGSVVSVGILGTAFRQRRRWAANIAVAVLTLCVAGLLFFSESRAGVLFLLVGVAGWVIGLGGHRDRTLLFVVALAALVGTGLFLTLKGRARDRLLGSIPVGTSEPGDTAAPMVEDAAGGKRGRLTTAEDRLRIYRDTLGMIRDVPLTGTGLGTFSLVFAPYRQASANASLVIHPESDWLMMAAETGLPALACLGGLIALVVGSWRPSREHPFWPVRWGLVAAVAAAALHGCVDVPAHRAALGWWMLTLAGLALQPGRVSEQQRGSGGWMARTIFASVGLVALLLGGMLVRAEWLGGPALPPYAAMKAQEAVARTFAQGDVQGATEQARQAIRETPFASPLYYQLGVLLIREEDTDAEIDRAFRRERVLNPWTSLIPLLQAEVWMPADSTRSIALFTESLQRQERLRGLSKHELDPLTLWAHMVRVTRDFPAVQNLLWDDCAGRESEYALIWLENATPANVKERLPQFAANEGALSEMSPGQRVRLLAAWKAKGDPAGLQAFLDTHDAGWPK